MKTSRTLFFSLLGALTAVALGVWLLLGNLEQVELTAQVRSHTKLVLANAAELLSALKDAETGERGYLLTGDEEFLGPYLSVLGGLDGRVAELRRLTLDLAAREHVERLVPLIDAKVAFMQRAVTLRREGDFSAAIDTVRAGQGKRAMDSIRAEMGLFVALEDGVLAQRELEFQSKMHRMFTLLALASAAAALFAVAFATLNSRLARQRLEQAVHRETRHSLAQQESLNAQLQQANVTLQVSEEKLAVTLSSIGDAVIATDAEGRVTFLNPLAERLTGWAQARANGRLVEEVFHIVNEETRLPATIPVQATLAHGTVHGLANHTVLIAREGLECPIADSCAPIRDRAGTVVGAVLVFRDVTLDHAAQQSLRESETRYRQLFESSRDALLVLAAPGWCFTDANREAQRVFGVGSSAAFAGSTPWSLSPERQPDGRLSAEMGPELIAKALGEGSHFFEWDYRRPSGELFSADVLLTRMEARGRVWLQATVRDITARKQGEAERALLDQRLRDHQFYTRSLFESNLDALMTTDPSGIITDVNKQMESLTGCSRDELIGAPFKTHFSDPERAGQGIEAVLSQKKVSNYELTARARDGQETVVSFNATTFYDRERRLQGVFAAARDVTERKRLDLVLQEKNVELEGARASAEQANLAKSEFLSSMSHELRSPLNAILGFAQLMESDAPAISTSQRESVAQILQAGWHLLTLINEILDLAKVEARQVPMSKEPVSLAEVLLECQGMIDAQAQQRSISLVMPRFEVPAFVIADRTRLKQVLLNLLSNAIKYNRKGGTVAVTCTEQPAKRLRVSIRDSGMGLAPAQVAQLFQPFNRLGQEAGGEEGTGIGLVVAKRLIELMGGEIGAQSTVGVGSEFWFELASVLEPRLREEVGAAVVTAPPSTPRAARPRSVLYVEDNPANLRLVEQIIARRPDLHLLTAVNGTLGIAIARGSRPDVILMDLNLPGINGFEALQMLRADPITAGIPVVAVSANAMPRDIERGLDAGFFQYITKPIRVGEFLKALDVALDFADLGRVVAGTAAEAPSLAARVS